jgi:hypothetical protein
MYGVYQQLGDSDGGAGGADSGLELGEDADWDAGRGDACSGVGRWMLHEEGNAV